MVKTRDKYKKSELGLIPEHWDIMPLKELFNIVAERKGLNDYPILSCTKEGLVFQSEHFNKRVASEDDSKYKVVRKGDVVASSLNLHLGGIDVQTLVEAGAVSPAYYVFRSKKNCIDLRFIRFLLRSKKYIQIYDTQITQIGASIVRRSTPRAKLMDLPILIPPLQEQRKIAEILTSVDDAIEKTKTIIKRTERIKKGLMQKLLLRGIGHTNFKHTNLGQIPESWSVALLSEYADVKSGLTKGRKIKSQLISQAPYLRVANVQDGYLDLSEVKFIDATVEEIERYRLYDGDVLLTEGGDIDKLGRGYIWRNEIPNCIHQNHVFRVRTNNKILLPEYLTYLAGSPYGKSYFLGCAKQTTNLASINSTQLKEFPIPLPPIEEQRRIAQVLQAIDRQINSERSTQNSLTILKQSLMQVLLTGKVRVKNIDFEVGKK